MKIQIKHSLSDEVLFEHDCENNSTCVTLELAIKKGANLAGAYLEGAYLEGVTLRRGEKLIGERPIFQVGPIGSRNDVLVAYITDQGLRLDAGCQRQITRDVFDARLSQTHGGNRHEREYRAALALLDAHVEIWTPAPNW